MKRVKVTNRETGKTCYPEYLGMDGDNAIIRYGKEGLACQVPVSRIETIEAPDPDLEREVLAKVVDL